MARQVDLPAPERADRGAGAGRLVRAGDRARIGLVDRLFSRVGASDDLARGRSTFMVEMVETAAILAQATTAALSSSSTRSAAAPRPMTACPIAWAVVEHLHEVNRCRCLFATHYHELTRLAERCAALALHTMRAQANGRAISCFSTRSPPGAADRCYGIHVARLAGLPAAVIARAEEVLQILENGEQAGALTRLADDLPLFRAARRAPPEPAEAPRVSPVEELLRSTRPDELTPRARRWN